MRIREKKSGIAKKSQNFVQIWEKREKSEKKSIPGKVAENGQNRHENVTFGLENTRFDPENDVFGSILVVSGRFRKVGGGLPSGRPPRGLPDDESTIWGSPKVAKGVPRPPKRVSEGVVYLIHPIPGGTDDPLVI